METREQQIRRTNREETERVNRVMEHEAERRRLELAVIAAARTFRHIPCWPPTAAVVADLQRAVDALDAFLDAERAAEDGNVPSNG